MYVPYAQFAGVVGSVRFAVRAAQNPISLAPSVRTLLRDASPTQPAGPIRSMDEIVYGSLTTVRFHTTLLALFGAMAVLIAAIGVYGVVSYFVAQRRHEIGIRMALGATRRDLLRMVLSQGVRMTAGGILLGLAASLPLTILAIAALLLGLRLQKRMSPIVYSKILRATLTGFVVLLTGQAAIELAHRLHIT